MCSTVSRRFCFRDGDLRFPREPLWPANTFSNMRSKRDMIDLLRLKFLSDGLRAVFCNGQGQQTPSPLQCNSVRRTRQCRQEISWQLVFRISIGPCAGKQRVGSPNRRLLIKVPRSCGNGTRIKPPRRQHEPSIRREIPVPHGVNPCAKDRHSSAPNSWRTMYPPRRSRRAPTPKTGSFDVTYENRDELMGHERRLTWVLRRAAFLVA